MYSGFSCSSACTQIETTPGGCWQSLQQTVSVSFHTASFSIHLLISERKKWLHKAEYCICSYLLCCSWFYKTNTNYIHRSHFSLNGLRPTAMNLTDFRDNALLKLQVGGPFTKGMFDLTNQEYILIQVEQTEPAGQRRRRAQQVRVSMWDILHLFFV